VSALHAVEPLPLRAVVYVRISRDPTGKQAGVERQERTCRDLADSLGWEVDRVLVDNDVSAFSGKRRPAYEELLALIERGEVEAVLAYHVDRIYRRMRDLVHLTEVLERHPVEIRTAQAGHVDLSTASGIFMAQVLGAAAQHESARTGERIVSQQRDQREAGRAHGGKRPYGFKRTGPGQLEVVTEEAEQIRWMAERLLAGDSQRSVAVALNERGVPTSQPGQWQRATVRTILRSPRLAGFIPYKGEVATADGEPVRGGWEPILDPTTWTKVRSMLDSAKRGRPPSRNLLARLLRCGRCGSTLRGRERLNGGEGRVYQCLDPDRRQGGRCSAGVSIVAGPVEDYIVNHVLEASRGAALARVRAERSVDGEAWLAQEIATDEGMLLELADDWANRRITSAQKARSEQIIQERLTEHRGRLAAIGYDPLPADLVSLDRADFDALTFDQQRAVIELFIDHAVIHPARPRAPRRFDPERVGIVPKIWRPSVEVRR